MISELFLDLYQYNNDKVLEVYTNKKNFEEALKKRGCTYESVKISDCNEKHLVDCDFLVMYLESDISESEQITLNYLISKSTKFIVVAENKLNFHVIEFDGKFVGITGLNYFI